MEEVIEQLRELNEPVPVPLELPEEETLVEIQEQILIHLPFELREFLLQGRQLEFAIDEFRFEHGQLGALRGQLAVFGGLYLFEISHLVSCTNSVPLDTKGVWGWLS